MCAIAQGVAGTEWRLLLFATSIFGLPLTQRFARQMADEDSRSDVQVKAAAEAQVTAVCSASSTPKLMKRGGK